MYNVMNIAIIRDTKRVKRTPTTVDKDGTMYRYLELESEVSDAYYNIMMAIQYESLLHCYVPGTGVVTGKLLIGYCLYSTTSINITKMNHSQ